LAIDRVRTGVALAGFCTFINMYPTQALLPTLASDFHTSLADTGLTVTATLVAVALVAPFVGSISDAFGRRRLILGAGFLMVLPTLLAAAAPTLPLLIGCRFAQGLLLPFIFAVTVAYIAEECPGAEGVRATGSYAIGTIFGGFGGRFIAGWTTDFVGWRAAFIALGTITLLAACVIAACLPAERRFRPVSGLRGTLSGFRDQFRNNQVMATCGVGFAVLFSIVATFTYANFLLAAAPYNLGPAELGSVFVVYLLGAAATPLAGRLTLRIGRRRTIMIGGLCGITGLLLTLLHSLVAIVAGMGLVAVGIFTEQVLSIGYVALAARQARSTAVGLYVTTYYVGGSLGGILPGWIWTNLGWPGCVALVMIVQAAMMTVTWLVWPADRGLR
jgi:predicted MFS family arabinose efflux permease